MVETWAGTMGALGAPSEFAADSAHDPERPARVEGRELEQYRIQLTKHARWLLGSHAAAEDAVQETMLAALQALHNFSGRSSLKTWLFGILRHKVTDMFRLQAREVPLDDDSDLDAEHRLNRLYSDNAHLREPPTDWGQPEETLMRQNFNQVLEACIDRLPKNIARVYMMRELMELETEQICRELGITSNNCFVMLHRARMALREQLQEHWFGCQPA